MLSLGHKIPGLARIPEFTDSGEYGKMRLFFVYTGGITAKCTGHEMDIDIHEEEDPPSAAQIRALKDQFCLPRYQTLRLAVLSRRTMSQAIDSVEWQKEDMDCETAVDRMIARYHHYEPR